MIQNNVKYFGTTSCGQEVHLISLENNNGMQVNILTYGATIKDIFFPIGDKRINTVLTYNSLSGYENGTSSIGAFVGRYANRIEGSSFKIDGTLYNLEPNEGKNHLHGTFSRRIFAHSFENESLVLTYTSPDGEDGFPGTLNVKLVYTLKDDNSLSIQYFANTDKPTVLNFTNHSYFNLNGDGKSILNHTLQMNSACYTPVNGQSIPTGQVCSVQNTPMDFRKEKTFAKDFNSDFDMLKIGNGYDHNWVLENNGKIEKFATLKADKTGLKADFYTDQPGVQIYTANYIHQDKGAEFEKNCAVCLETQHYPDSPNKQDFPSTVLRPYDIFKSTTIIKFYI